MSHDIDLKYDIDVAFETEENLLRTAPNGL